MPQNLKSTYSYFLSQCHILYLISCIIPQNPLNILSKVFTKPLSSTLIQDYESLNTYLCIFFSRSTATSTVETIMNLDMMKKVKIMAGFSPSEIPIIKLKRMNFIKATASLPMSEANNLESDHLIKYCIKDKGVELHFFQFQFTCQNGDDYNKCGKKFLNRKDLSQHEKIHLAIQCVFCDKKFHSKENLFLHKKINHGSNAKSIQCKYCRIFFKNQRGLRRHLNNNYCEGVRSHDKAKLHYLNDSSISQYKIQKKCLKK